MARSRSTPILRRLRAVLLLALALAVVAVLPRPAQAAELIEGAWIYQGGRVLVESTGPGTYRGTVSRSTRFLDCPHPTGEQMWNLSGSGTSYSGTHAWFQAPGCTPAPGGLARWSVREDRDRLLLDFCTAPPGTTALDGPETRCSTLERAKPPTGSPVQVCLLDTCIEGAGDTQSMGCVRRGNFTHRFRVRLRRKERRLMKVTQVVFKLDGKRNGSDRRTPFLARVNGRRLDAGSHVLTADVRMTARKKRGGKRRTARTQLRYRFDACD